jgi:hypothetical protein
MCFLSINLYAQLLGLSSLLQCCEINKFTLPQYLLKLFLQHYHTIQRLAGRSATRCMMDQIAPSTKQPYAKRSCCEVSLEAQSLACVTTLNIVIQLKN